LSLCVDCKFDIRFDIEFDENWFPQLNFPQVANAEHFSQINTSNFFDLVKRLVPELLISFSPKTIGTNAKQLLDRLLAAICGDFISKYCAQNKPTLDIYTNSAMYHLLALLHFVPNGW